MYIALRGRGGGGVGGGRSQVSAISFQSKRVGYGTRVWAVLQDKISFFSILCSDFFLHGAQSLCNFLDRGEVHRAIKHILSVPRPKWFLYVEDFYVVLLCP
jgi:hypothetical protein